VLQEGVGSAAHGQSEERGAGEVRDGRGKGASSTGRAHDGARARSERAV
jgi:hypothetical protein